VKVVVLVKAVADLSHVRYSKSERRLVESGERLLAPISEHVLEAARQIKTQAESMKLIGFLLGRRGEVSALRKAMAFGLDQGVMIEAKEDTSDHFLIARVLKAAVDKLGSVHALVVGGASDAGGGGQTGLRVGEALGLDWVNMPEEVAKSKQGAAIVVELGTNEPKIPNVMAVMKAGKKEITHWKVEELLGEGDRTPVTSVLREEWVG